MPRFFFLSECAAMATPGADHPGRRWFLPILLGATAAFKLLLAWVYAGFLSGDDLEIVETAARYATGLAYQPWTIRSMLHPLLAWPGMELGVFAGLASPHWLTFLACLPTVLLSTLSIALLYRLALALSWSETEARAAAFLFAFHWLPLTYGATPYPRPISTCLLLGAFLLVAASGSSPRHALAAGVLAAAAMAVRWSEGLMLLPLLGFAAWRGRDLRRPRFLLGGFVAGTLIFVGLLDAWTWGRPFASLIAFLRTSGPTHFWGSQPRAWSWYGTMVLRWAGPLFLLLAAAAWRDCRVLAPLAIAVSAVVLFSLSPLKQLRYMQVAIPFLAMAAALGWGHLREGTAWRRGLATGAFVLAIPLGLERTFATLRSKSAPALAAAGALAHIDPTPRRIVLEQMWAYGERLYLGDAVEIRDLLPRTPLPAETVAASLPGAEAIGLYAEDVDGAVARTLADAGFRPCAIFERARGRPVILYLPASVACPAPGNVTSGPPRS